MIKVNLIFNNTRWKNYLKTLERFFNTKINLFNKKDRNKKNIFICSLLLSGPLEIKKLNKKFRKKSKITDVLSFPFYKKKKLNNLIKKEKEIYIGDIIINLDYIKKKKDKRILKNELLKLWIHGLVHLLGHDHKKDKDFNAMKKVEKKYLQLMS